MNEARMMDTADRFVNCKSAKYYLRASAVDTAIDTAALFTRVRLTHTHTHTQHTHTHTHALSLSLCVCVCLSLSLTHSHTLTCTFTPFPLPPPTHTHSHSRRACPHSRPWMKCSVCGSSWNWHGRITVWENWERHFRNFTKLIM